jgi:hypothetical protein
VSKRCPRTLLSLLLSSWGALTALAYAPRAERPPASRGKLQGDVRILCHNRFKILETLEDKFPPYTSDVSLPVRKNAFLEGTLRELGGGEAVLESKLSIYERRGGGIDDGWKTMRDLDRKYAGPCRFSFSVEEQCRFIGLEPGGVAPLPFDEAVSGTVLNLDANPGPTFKALGFAKKSESVALAMDMAREVVDEAASRDVVGFLKPRYAIAGRAKLSEVEKNRIKAETMRPFGRAILMGDQHESLVASMFTVPLLDVLHRDMRVITNGFNKFGNDPSRVCAALSRFNTFINGDFSQFDVRCGPKLIARAFEVLRCAFGATRRGPDQTSRLLDWLEDEIIYSDVVLYTGATVRKAGGVPSGTGMTAVLDSVINALMWQEALYQCGVGDHHVFVHGDDNLIGLSYQGGPGERRAEAARLVSRLASVFAENFDHELGVDKTTIGVSLFVGFAQPIVPEGISDHSRQVVRQYRLDRARALGRPLTFTEKFRVLQREPIGPAPGNTHRWTYIFHGRAKFLSHYFKPDPSSGKIMCVRPTAEVVANLLYPERPVKTLLDHRTRLVAAWVENMGNHHVTNHVMHYLYDVFVAEKHGVHKRPLRPGAEGRAWYRKVDRVVDLLDEDPDFFEYWRQFEKMARSAHSAVFGGRYASWEKIKALRRGKMNLTMGGPLSRVPNFSEERNLYQQGRLVEILGPLGFSVWSTPRLRSELVERVLALYRRGESDHGAGSWYSLTNSIIELRRKYSSDFP